MLPLTLYKRRGLHFPGGFNAGFDPNHIASNGCVFSAISTGAGALNLLNPGIKPTALVTAPTAKIDGIPGVTGSFPATNGNGLSFSGALPLTTDNTFTAAWIARPNVLSGTNIYLQTSNFSAGWWMGIVSSNWMFTAPIQTNIFSGITPVVGVPYFVIMSATATAVNVYSANFLVLRLDTGQVQTAALTGQSTTGPTVNDGFMTYGGSPLGVPDCGARMACAMYNNNLFLSTQQMLQWAKDPWGFWYPTPANVSTEQVVSNTRISNWSTGTSLGTNNDSSLGVSTLSITVGATAPVGSLVVVSVEEFPNTGNPGTGGTVADSQGNIYTKANSKGLNNNAAVNGVGVLYYSVLTTALTGSVDTITYTLVNLNSVSMSVANWTNSAGTISLDLNTTPTSGSSSTPSITSGTPTQIGELFVGSVYGLGSPTQTIKQPAGFQTPPTGVSVISSPQLFGGQLQDVATNIQTYNPTGAGTGTWAEILVSFKFTAAGGDVLQAQIWM